MVSIGALGDADEDAVDDGELGEPAGGRAGAERRLAGRGGEHVVAELGERRPREVGHRDGGGAVALRQRQRVDGVLVAPECEIADRDVPG